MKNIITILIIFLFQFTGLGQTLNKAWFSPESNLCLTIDSNSAKINCFEDMKLKKDGNIIKITYYYTTGIRFWRQKDNYYYKIEKLTQDTLILSQDFEKNMWEVLPYSTTIFHAEPGGCDDKWEFKNE